MTFPFQNVFGVSIISVRYLDLYRVTLCTCSIVFRSSQREEKETAVQDTQE